MEGDSRLCFMSAKTANDFSLILSFVVSVLRVMEEMLKTTSEPDETDSGSDMSDVQDVIKHAAKEKMGKYLNLLNIMPSVLLWGDLSVVKRLVLPNLCIYISENCYTDCKSTKKY